VSKVDGLSLGLVSAGIVIGYSGIKGYSLGQTIQDIVTGKSPLKQAVTSPITGTVVPDAPAGGTPTGQQIATDALAYQGHCYHYGGAPGTDGSGCWDCSSFANWVIGHDMGMAIPGYKAGTYDGSVHGPSTLSWLAWTGVHRISPASAGAGDIACWQTHMGIMTGPDSMISAQTPDSGTRVATGNIANFMPGEVLFVLRLKATLPPGGSSGVKR